MTEKQHFAIGLIVDVKDEAAPAGMNKSSYRDDVPKRATITEVYFSGGEGDTYCIGGWWWKPTDFVVVGF